MTLPPPPIQSTAKQDLAICIGGLTVLFVLAGYLDLFERWYDWSQTHEDWELDEILTASALSALGFAWYSFRRWQESRREAVRFIEVNRTLDREIAAREETERSLRESEERLYRASQNSRIRIWSWSVESRLTQYLPPREDVRDSWGRPASEAFISEVGLLDAIHPDDRQRLSELWDRAYAEHIPYEIEYRLVLPNGELRHNHEIGTPEFDESGRYLGHFGTTQDITERKRADIARHESEELFSRAFHASSVLFAIVRPEDNTHYDVNKAWVSTFGYSREEAIGHTALELGIWAVAAQRAPFLERLEKERSVRGFEATFRTKNGKLLHFLVAGEYVEVGDTARLFVASQDITERVQTERALRESEELFSRAFHSSPVLFAISRPEDGTHYDVNETWISTLGYSHEEAMAHSALELGVWADSAQRVQFVERLKKERSVRGFEAKFRTKDGRLLDFLVAGEYIEVGDTVRLFVVSQDITERVKSERALRESEERLRQASQIAKIGHYVWDSIEDRCLFCSEEHARVHGMTPSEYIARASPLGGPFSLTHPDDREAARESFKCLRAGERLDMEYRIVTPSGRTHYVHEIAEPVFDDNGRVVQEIGTTQDITEIKRSETLLKRALDASSAYCALFDADDRLIVCNEMYRKTNETPEVPIVPGVPLERIVRAFAANVGVGKSEAETQAWIDKRQNRRRTPAQCFEYQRGDGEWIEVSDTLLEDGSLFTIGMVVTERKRMAEALRAREAYLNAFFAHSSNEIAIKDAEGRYILFNPEAQRHFGLTAEQVVGKTTRDLYPKDIAVRIEAQERRVVETGKPSQQEIVADTQMGRRIFSALKFPIYDDAGKFLGLGGIATDITDRKQAEEQLRQAQKMEALGRLTGGVAHDFNNMLTAIIGNLEILGDHFDDNAGAKRSLDIAFKAALNAAGLTRSLLTFSRQRRLESKTVDLRAAILGMGDLLRTTLGAPIRLSIRLPEALQDIVADPVQLESAIVNLAVNARYAMPDGGRLTIEAANAEFSEGDTPKHSEISPGAYVVLAVSDTGTGMPQAVKERVFEPFFTTKDVGEGTGLGLSMVFGFANQLGGHVTLDSEEGRGTCVTLYLPASGAAEVEQSPRPATPSDEYRGNGETILVVEDDAGAAETASVILTGLGYRVMLAGSGPAALSLLQKHGDVDLVFTDTVLPDGMNGIDLAREAQQRFPGLKFLHTSGYPGENFDPNPQVDEDMDWIAKPYLPRTLAEKIHQALAKSRARRLERAPAAQSRTVDRPS